MCAYNITHCAVLYAEESVADVCVCYVVCACVKKYLHVCVCVCVCVLHCV